jgi:hypothetical protein
MPAIGRRFRISDVVLHKIINLWHNKLPMKYTIYGRQMAGESRNPMFGFEIQPPLIEQGKSFEGDKSPANQLAEALIDKPGPKIYSTGFEYMVSNTHVTRNDAEGTALRVEGNMYCGTVQTVAQRIASLIDPCGLHEVNIKISPEQ